MGKLAFYIAFVICLIALFLEGFPVHVLCSLISFVVVEGCSSVFCALFVLIALAVGGLRYCGFCMFLFFVFFLCWGRVLYYYGFCVLLFCRCPGRLLYFDVALSNSLYINIYFVLSFFLREGCSIDL